MSTRTQGRDPNEIAIERASPGLTCDWTFVDRSSVEFRVIGTADALIAAGLILPTHLDILPPCGVSSPGQQRCKKLGIPYWWVEIRRLPDGLFRVRRWWNDRTDDSPHEIVEKYGLQSSVLTAQKTDTPAFNTLTPPECALVAAFRCAHPEGKAAFESLAAAMMERFQVSQPCGDRVRERAVGRLQRLARWHVSGGKLITIDWRAHRVDA